MLYKCNFQPSTFLFNPFGMQGTQTPEKNELLAQQFNIDYNRLPIMFRHGSSIFWDKVSLSLSLSISLSLSLSHTRIHMFALTQTQTHTRKITKAHIHTKHYLLPCVHVFIKIVLHFRETG